MSQSTVFHADSDDRVSQIMVVRGDANHPAGCISLTIEITEDQYDSATKTETTLVAHTLLHREQVKELVKGLQSWLESVEKVNPYSL